MSTKSSVLYHSASDTHLYEEAFWPEDHISPAFVDLRNPSEFSINHEGGHTQLTIAIEAGIMDEIAMAWCRHRNLVQSGAVGAEYGGPECEYK